MKKIGFLFFGHWTPDPHSQTQSAAPNSDFSYQGLPA